MIIAGLIFNLLGSLFLAYSIIGIERLKRFEQKILNFPSFISFGLLGWVFYAAIRTMFKNEFKDYKWGDKYIKGRKLNNKEIKEIFKKVFDFHWEGDLEYLFGIILRDPVKTILIFGLFFWIFYRIILSPLIGFITGIVKLFSKVQNIFEIESLFGVIGVNFLIIGFILQLIGNLMK